ncbi:MAG TPA: adenylate/guanylate cyclase domain-containing protein [Myxococcaceae bacterium]|nr:adenylate/guanylate cyclase domain-containing protein [Myxococcaceae bacterium]
MARTESTVARAELARQNEEAVLSESSLRGARIVSVVRLAVCLLMSAAMAWIPLALGRAPPHQDFVRTGAVLFYIVFAVASFMVLRTMTPQRAWVAIRASTAVMLIDFAFPTFMAARSYAVGDVREASSVMGAAALGLTICYSISNYHWLQVALATVIASVAFLTTSWYTNQFDLSPCLFVVGMYIGTGMLIGRNNQRIRTMFLELRRRDNLTRFLAPEIAEQVMSLGRDALAPVQREVTVLFSDIRNFTTLSEALPPDAVLKFLDEYFGHMTQLVKGHHGIVNKFIGDGMLAFWNVPTRHEEHAVAAVRAALDMRKVLAELNAARAAVGADPIRIGVGIHTGVVAAGMLGGAEQHEYTVIGDAVNVASRVEGLTKAHGVDVLVSERTWELVKDRFACVRKGEDQVKGRTERVVVYAVNDAIPGSDTRGAAA